MSTDAPYAFVRVGKIDGPMDMKRLEAHGRGLGDTARDRRVVDDPEALRALYWRFDMKKLYVGRPGCTFAPARVCDAYEKHLAECGAKVRSNAQIASNLIVGVSPSWLDSPDDPDDEEYRRDVRRNRRPQRLLRAAVKWAEKEFGGGSRCVFSARLDLDEHGTGNVDLFIAPTRLNKRSKNRFVSVRTAFGEFATRHGQPSAKSYAPMQDSWAKFASEELGTEFRRGAPKELSGREHLTPEAMRDIVGREARKASRDETAKLKSTIDQLTAAISTGDIEAARQTAARLELLPEPPAKKRKRRLKLPTPPAHQLLFRHEAHGMEEPNERHY